ncbi:042a63f6-cded-4602-9062-69a9447c7e06 [Sclerotinia trifoliorum]|uniref:042a63f6-cded-4602-9062-69a9447c7e06 n=1 Tax=Sclerotinia trifoliorum TaxID=28548 RepID=A0A8H2VVF2_9HELO|nr:042a63f6-cded-4602-9062-69a9447c7e06 [Sclerotinia trifoliorum]
MRPTILRSTWISPRAIISSRKSLNFFKHFHMLGYSNRDEFILGGSFADMRDPKVLKQSRDPGYCSPDGGFDDENGDGLQHDDIYFLVDNSKISFFRHVTPQILSAVILNTKIGHITVIGQESGCCEDPGLFGFPERPEGPNRNSHAHLPSRHVKEFFEECTNRLLKLQWIPNSEDRRMLCECGEEYADLKLLFRTYGWPRNFNSTGFDSAYTRWREFIDIKQDAAYCANVIHAIHHLDCTTERLNFHSRRLRNGIWDRDPVQRATFILERTIAEHGGWDGERTEMVKAWKKYFEDSIEREEKDLKRRKGEGKNVCKQEEFRKIEEEIKVLKERLMNVDGQPMTAGEAIRSL